MTDPARDRLALAVDCPDLETADALVARVADCVGYLKIGLELFVRYGPQALELAERHQLRTFLDLKLHDIPATVERAVSSACELGVSLLTVHASGGFAMIEAAAKRVAKEGSSLRLLAVTVLTSLDANDLRSLGVAVSPEEQVLRLGRLAVDAGAHGLVCSPAETRRLRVELGASPLLVTPGIRSAKDPKGDQKRVATPREAVRAGANLLVVGRPIRDAVDPRGAALALCREVAQACLE